MDASTSQGTRLNARHAVISAHPNRVPAPSTTAACRPPSTSTPSAEQMRLLLFFAKVRVAGSNPSSAPFESPGQPIYLRRPARSMRRRFAHRAHHLPINSIPHDAGRAAGADAARFARRVRAGCAVFELQLGVVLRGPDAIGPALEGLKAMRPTHRIHQSRRCRDRRRTARIIGD